MIINYIGYLLKTNINVTTRKIALIHFRTFHEICIQEKWLPLPIEPLVYQADFLYRVSRTPKYTPEMAVFSMSVIEARSAKTLTDEKI